jgi:hypothetical protein
MRRLNPGEQIGQGAYKKVYLSKENYGRVIAEYHKNLSENQIKSLYYLNKLFKIFFPQNIPEINAAYNLQAQGAKKSILYSKLGYRDELHKKTAKTIIETNRGESGGNKQDKDKMHDYIHSNEQNPKITQFIKMAEQKGFFVDKGGQNFAIDENGIVSYLESNPAWVILKQGTPEEAYKYFVDIDKLRGAIVNLDPSVMPTAIKYFERLVKLMPK